MFYTKNGYSVPSVKIDIRTQGLAARSAAKPWVKRACAIFSFKNPNNLRYLREFWSTL